MIAAYYVARGEPAYREAVASIASLHRFHDIPVTLMTDQTRRMHHADFMPGSSLYPIHAKELPYLIPECDPGGRQAKIRLLEFADPDADHVLYLDADTRIIGRLPVDQDLWPPEGFDIAITLSAAQGADAMWHIGAEERAATLLEIGDPAPLCYNAGVFLMADNPRTRLFCGVWLEEWYRWRNQDQAAFLRALHRVPLRVWTLGRDYNGGSIIQHRFGMAKDEKTR